MLLSHLSSLPQVVTSTSNNLTVYYHTGDMEYSGRGMKAEYRSGCEGRINGDFGQIFSPGYLSGSNYPNFQECSWTVQSESNVAMNFIVDDNFAISGVLGDDELKVREISIVRREWEEMGRYGKKMGRKWGRNGHNGELVENTLKTQKDRGTVNRCNG